MDENYLVRVFRSLTERNPKGMLLTLEAIAQTARSSERPVSMDSWRACVDVLTHTVQRLEATSDDRAPNGRLSEQRIVRGLAVDAVCAIVASFPKVTDPNGHPMQARTIEPWLSNMGVCSRCGAGIGANSCYQCSTCTVCMCTSCARDEVSPDDAHDERSALANHVAKLLGEIQDDNRTSMNLLEAFSTLNAEPEEVEVTLFTVIEMLSSASEDTRRLALKVIWQLRDRINSTMASAVTRAICHALAQDMNNMLASGFALLSLGTLLDKPGSRTAILGQAQNTAPSRGISQELHTLMVNVIQLHGTCAPLVTSAMRVVFWIIEHNASAVELVRIRAVEPLSLALEQHIADAVTCESITKVISSILVVEAHNSIAHIMLTQHRSLPDLLLRAVEAYPEQEEIVPCALNSVIALVQADMSTATEFNVAERLAHLSLSLGERHSTEITAFLLQVLSMGAAGEAATSVIVASLFTKWSQAGDDGNANRRPIVLTLAGIAEATVADSVWGSSEMIRTIIAELERPTIVTDHDFAEGVFKIAASALGHASGAEVDLAPFDRFLIQFLQGPADVGPNLLMLVHRLTAPARPESLNVILNMREENALVQFARRRTYQLTDLVTVVEIMERLIPDGRTSDETGQAIVEFTRFSLTLLRHAQGALATGAVDACARLAMRVVEQHRAFAIARLFDIIPVIAERANPPEMRRLSTWLSTAIVQPALPDPEECNICDICDENPRNCVSCRQCCHPTCEACDQRIRTIDGPGRGLCMYCRSPLGDRVRLRL